MAKLRTRDATSLFRRTSFEAVEVLCGRSRELGGYQPISAYWQTLTAPITKRLHGHNQVTDAYLLGLALREGMVLVTLDRALLHLAGEHRDHVLLLGAEQAQ